MKKLSALLLTLILTLSLAACKKDATSSDASGLSNIPSQTEQRETDISAEQTSGITAESEAENKTEPAPTSTTPDKKAIHQNQLLNKMRTVSRSQAHRHKIRTIIKPHNRQSRQRRQN